MCIVAQLYAFMTMCIYYMYACILMGVQIFILLMHFEYLFLKHFDFFIENHCFFLPV